MAEYPSARRFRLRPSALMNCRTTRRSIGQTINQSSVCVSLFVLSMCGMHRSDPMEVHEARPQERTVSFSSRSDAVSSERRHHADESNWIPNFFVILSLLGVFFLYFRRADAERSADDCMSEKMMSLIRIFSLDPRMLVCFRYVRSSGLPLLRCVRQTNRRFMQICR